MMHLRISASVIAFVLGMHVPAMAAMYNIMNPADKISNPADKIFNPATIINNPAINIYNPAGRMDNPNPLSPPTQPIQQPKEPETNASTKLEEQIKKPAQAKPKPYVPVKIYNFKTAKGYVNAAKKAFIRDEFVEFLSIVEDAFRRIDDGTLKASKKTTQKLNKYKIFGYGLIEKDEE
jgi:hypothetical protein